MYLRNKINSRFLKTFKVLPVIFRKILKRPAGLVTGWIGASGTSFQKLLFI